MTLYNLAIKNIWRNVKDYTLYIGSIVFTIAIYFTFVTLKHSEELMLEAGSMTKISSLMNMASILLLIFAAIFIAYSNAFFLRKRNKEIGLYLLLGIRKNKIALMLFVENIVIGLGSLFIGVILGFIVSQGLFGILVKLMGFSLLGGVPLSLEAIQNTIVVFVLLFLLTSFQGYKILYKSTLLDLFHAVKKGDTLPKANGFVVLLGIGLLVIAYYFASVDLMTSEAWRTASLAMPFIILISTIVGTYLLFHTVLVFVFSVLKNNKRWSWRGLNLFTASQMLYRIRSHAKTLTIIAVLSATTITAGGAVFGLYYNVNTDTKKHAPNTFMWQGEAIELKDEAIVLYESLAVKDKAIEDASGQYQYSFVAQSSYNQLAEFHQKPIVQLSEQEVYIVDQYIDARPNELSPSSHLEVDGEILQVQGFSQETIYNGQLIFITAVVSDARFEQLTGDITLYQIVNTTDELKQLPLSKYIDEQLEGKFLSSLPENYNESIQAIGVLLFIGTFLGLVFLVATGSIIFFKMMTEAEDDKAKYEGMHKIGIGFSQIQNTIRTQVGIIFAVPLVLGIMHAGFALKTFSGLFMLNIVQPVVIWMVLYSFIYGIYYVLTVRYFNKTIKRRLQGVEL